jgi:hypothetical protein
MVKVALVKLRALVKVLVKLLVKLRALVKASVLDTMAMENPACIPHQVILH